MCKVRVQNRIIETVSMDSYYLIPLFFIIAFLYASVGHGGASGYLGLMALAGISAVWMKPSALVLNILVSGIATVQFYRAGYFHTKLLLPFIILSIPCAYLGSRIPLQDHIYKIVLGICLIISVGRIVMMQWITSPTETRPVPLLPALLIGGSIGLVSGMIGIGGGIILSPVLLLLRWSGVKETAAVSAPFIVVNSLAGIVGLSASSLNFPPYLMYWVVAAVLGGLAGAWWGSKKFNVQWLRYILSVVLLFAAFKLFIT